MTTKGTNMTDTKCEACGVDSGDELYHNDELGMAVCAECDAAGDHIEKAAPAPKVKKATTPVELSTKDVAEKVGTDPKTLRQFLRASSDYAACGSGSRYSFTAKDIAPMKTRFNKWTKERAAAKVERDKAKAAALADAAEATAQAIIEAEA